MFSPEMLEYLLMCFLSGILGVFAFSFPQYKGARYFKDYYKIIISSGFFSVFLSRTLADIIFAMWPKIVIEPPYPIGFAIGIVLAYLLVNPSSSKFKRLFKVILTLIGIVKLDTSVLKDLNDENKEDDK